MSADLLKEFGDLEEIHLHRSADQILSANDFVEDDVGDFGDFEEPGLDNTQIDKHGNAKPFTDAVGLSSGHDGLGLVSISDGSPGSWESKNRELSQERPFSNTVRMQQSNTAIGSNEPDWDNFETGTVLFDAEADPPPKQPISIIKGAKEIAPGPQIDFGDDVDAWEPEEITKQDMRAEALEPQAKLPALPNPSTLQVPSPKSDVTEPPPTNVPPPSILLSLCTTFLQSLSLKLRNLSGENEPSRSIFQSCTSNLRATARILAGRKLRWKRDMILSQSMKIGPSGKQGGMKLTGVDKTESRREDQEAAELLRIWRQQIGLLRSAVATFKGTNHNPGLVPPELAENMPVRLGKSGEGAVTAPKACFLCGVKRDERVLKVDVDVEDSFGEWWTEHWGHVDCVKWWAEQKTQLIQR